MKLTRLVSGIFFLILAVTPVMADESPSLMPFSSLLEENGIDEKDIQREEVGKKRILISNEEGAYEEVMVYKIWKRVDSENIPERVTPVEPLQYDHEPNAGEQVYVAEKQGAKEYLARERGKRDNPLEFEYLVQNH